MFISRTAAQEIVEEIGREIQENINMMDQNGFIIASTDSARIGQQHPGAVRIITEKLPELVITGEMEKEHMKMGINLPLVVHGEVVGVIGITGLPEKVSRYGSIVRHMTEIMVTDTLRNNSKRYGHRVSYRFLEEWIEASTIPAYESHFVERGLRLGIDITKPYRILALSFFEYQELSSSLAGQELLESMETTVRHLAEKQNLIYLRTPPYQLMFVPESPDKKLERIARNYIDTIRQEYHQAAAIGYDSAYGTHTNLKQAVSESQAALRYAIHNALELAGYDSLGIHFLLQQISTTAKIEFSTHFVSGIPEEKRPEYYQLMNAYFKYNGSLQKMSEALFLHKNTLQYKLKKLSEYTGLDIRDARSAAAYFMFLAIYQDMQR